MVKFECRDKSCNFEDYYDHFKSPSACPKCGSKIYTLVFTDKKEEKKPIINIDGTSRDNPRWSWSMGVNKQDIPEMMKKYPERTYHPKTGQLLVKNRQHKKKLMKEHGFEEMG